MKWDLMFVLRTTLPIRFLLLVTVVLWMVPVSGFACPGCKEAVASQSDGGDVAAGYFWSVLFMLSMPYVILATLGMLFYRMCRKARIKEQRELATATVASDHA